MEAKEVLQCSFENWYPTFKNETPKSICIPLPDGFVDYLLADSIILPKSEEPFQNHSKAGDSSDDDDDDEEETNWDDEESAVPEPPKFDEFDVKIRDSIRKLGGKVFPKLNWSSPWDASWIALNNSCCCTNVSDIYLLLKSSSRVVYDLTRPFFYCVDQPKDNNSEKDAKHRSSVHVTYHLVLREWMEIDPSTEFRCFVKDNSLIGVSQREHSVYFGHIHHEKNEIIQDIAAFFTGSVQYKFPSSSYVFDVCRKKKGNVILLDFNPFGEMTDSLLFEWNELRDSKVKRENDSLPEFCYVVDNHGVQPKPFCHYALPTDIVDISTGVDSVKFVDMLKLMEGQQLNENSSDEE